jgi:hypothetical protein
LAAFGHPHIFEIARVTTNLLQYYRKDFFKGTQWKIQIRFKIFKNVILGCDPFWLPLTPFISETMS